jgi:putative tryptophan/tyrosine transport system substrate-binding protein
MRRREFFSLLGGAAAWPLAAPAQQAERMRRIGVLVDTAENSSEGKARFAAFRQMLRERNWVEGYNVEIDTRWFVSEGVQTQAAELVALAPDAIFAISNSQLRLLSVETRTIPIVFVGASDPVGAGYIESFAHPGGNITGFTLFEASMAGKWLAALKEISPAITRVAIMVNPETGTLRGTFYSHEFEASASALSVESNTAVVRSANDIEAAIVALSQHGHSGLIVAPDGFTNAHEMLIVGLLARHRVPAIFGLGNFVRNGGLMSYGPDLLDACRRAAIYIDRILRGEKPADLPVQAPVKYELLMNLKTAKALGLELPLPLLIRADEVIE